MIDLVIVRAPHQLLYSIERLNNSKLKCILILDMFKVQDYNDTLTRLLKYKKWDLVIKLNYEAKNVLGLMKNIYYLFTIKILSYFNIKINNLIIGDGSIVFAKLISDNFKHIENTIVIGDGTDLIVRNKSWKEIRYYCLIGNKMKRLLKILNLRFNDEYKFDELFTYFQVKDPRLVLNDFVGLRNTIMSKSNFVDHESIYFLGSLLLDRFDAKEVKNIYNQIFDCYPTLKIKYFPHRRATLEEIEIVRSIGIATIIENKGEIIETYFVSNNIIPVTLGSFFSNAVFSLAAIYPQLNIDIFYVQKEVGSLNQLERRIKEILFNEMKNERIRCRVLGQ